MSSNDHSTRQVLPLSAAVSTSTLPRFRQRDHACSALVREILDQFNHETERRFAAVPAPERDVGTESIVMQGAEILNTMRTGSHVVKQRRTSDHAPLPLELEVVAAEPFVPVVTTLRTDAAAALEVLNNRKPRKVAPAPKRSWLSRLLGL